jgi:hypothetical protein
MWQPGRVPLWEDEDEQALAVRTLDPERRGAAADAGIARRGVATFGARPDDPTVTDTVRGFFRQYGWRAYALPVLVAITVLALVTARSSPKPATNSGPGGVAGQPGVPTASGNIALKSDTPGSGSHNSALVAAALPPGASYTKQGDGTYRVLAGTSPVVGTGTVRRYSVEVENGITGIDLGEYGRLVQSVLSDPRSWAGHDGVALQRVDSGPVDFHVTLVSSMTVRQLCGFDIPIETSCFVPTDPATGATENRVAFNDARWVRGAAAYVGDINSYRIYMINH